MKRAQLSTFIIIGVIILISAALIVYIRARVTNDTLIPELDTVPAEFAEVQQYVLRCVELTGTEALVRVGEHGGYLDPLNASLTGRSFHVAHEPTESDALLLSPDHAIPYWWYLSTPSDCTECEVSDSQIPTVVELQDQINRYVDRTLETCLAGFSDFTAKGYTIKVTEPPTTRTIIGNNTLFIYTRLPLSLSYRDKKTVMANFPYEIDINLKDMYGLALTITYQEMDRQFLETAVMHLISGYSDVDSSKLPPLSSFDQGFSTVVWSKTAVEQRLQGIIQSMVPLLQLENTRSYKPIVGSDQFETALYDVFTIPNNDSYPFEVHFIDLSWPIHFDITPRTGDLLKPTSYRRDFPWGIAPTTQTNHYEFFYDVSYPVVVEIRDPSALRGRGYSFLFALEGNIIDNRNLALWHAGEGTIGPWDYSRVSYGVADLGKPLSVVEYVPETGTTVNRTFEKPAQKLFCDENQRISGNITVHVTDGDAPVGMARISFGCGRYATCSMGETGSSGELTTRFPVCIGGGYVLVERDSYTSAARSNLTVKPLVDNSIDIVIVPETTVNVTVKTVSSTGPSQAAAVKLLPNEKVVLTVSRIKQDPAEPDRTQTLIVQGNRTEDIGLAPGNYSIQATLIDTVGFTIPAHKEKYGDQEVDVPAIEMTPAVLGGAVLDSSTSIWQVTDLDDVVTFYVFKSPVPKTMQEMQLLTGFQQQSKTYRKEIAPAFSRS
jgi:hypothetical protein